MKFCSSLFWRNTYSVLINQGFPISSINQKSEGILLLFFHEQQDDGVSIVCVVTKVNSTIHENLLFEMHLETSSLL